MTFIRKLKDIDFLFTRIIGGVANQRYVERKHPFKLWQKVNSTLGRMPYFTSSDFVINLEVLKVREHVGTIEALIWIHGTLCRATHRKYLSKIHDYHFEVQ
ncbi:hypothetical protein ACTXT7_009945 [Hymenolepis weldensis]